MLLEEKIEDAAKLAERRGELRGLEMGRQEGILETFRLLVNLDKLTLDKAAEQAGKSKEEFQKHMNS